MPSGYSSPGWKWLIAIGLVVIILTGIFGFLLPAVRTYLSTTLPPTAPLAGAVAFCPATSTVTSITSPPPGCFNQAEILQITVQEWNPGIGSPTNSFCSGCFPGGTSATSKIAVQIFQLQPSGWVNTENLLDSSTAGVVTTANTYLPGSQIQIHICENTSKACTVSQYTTTSTNMYCPLPALVGSGICGTGPGSGYVPFSTTPSASTAPTTYFYAPIVPTVNDQYLGQNSATAEKLWLTFENNTQVAAASSCFVKSATGGSQWCNGAAVTGTASINNARFFFTYTITPNVACNGAGTTVPVAPCSFGYSTYTQVDPSLQSGTTARGSLQYVLQVAVKETGSSDFSMCVIQSVTGTSVTTLPPISVGGSSTSTLYQYVIPDSAITKSTDSSGNPFTSGQVTLTISVDCSQVYGDSSATVTITPTQYAFYSTKYVASYTGNVVNPEAQKTGGGADGTALTIKS